MQKSLDQMNVQVHRALTNLAGITGMAIIRAIVAGERDPATLADFRDKRCKKSKAEIAEHLAGNWREEHLFNLSSSLRLYDAVQALIDQYDSKLLEEIEALQPPERKDEKLAPHPNPTKQRSLNRLGDQEARTALFRFSGVDLTRIDGISAEASRVILTEVGLDLTGFPSEKEFVSWLRLSPRVSYSAGKALKKKSKGTGATRIAGVLRMAALSLSRSKTALGAEFRRLARRKDGAVAGFAIARKLAQLVYRMLRFGQDYIDIGEAAYEARYRARRLQALQANATELGYDLVQAVA
jgi:transposase